MEMRTTEVRVLLPDAWGFVCPGNFYSLFHSIGGETSVQTYHLCQGLWHMYIVKNIDTKILFASFVG